MLKAGDYARFFDIDEGWCTGTIIKYQAHSKSALVRVSGWGLNIIDKKHLQKITKEENPELFI